MIKANLQGEDKQSNEECNQENTERCHSGDPYEEVI